ncbi:BlaI/MecI/CopY family transcriptional regulator [Synechococcus sp. Nb3U1]|uniref:BlaI/MecI/CopY family transcriptional regulator n=1 Tax=Synechococcus sp. Nb3U1 TaxID=1914529 RepID=UPI001F36F7C4|nr:BlaI/MecI/CopY family transcriptional regulator [Synechococcus sp. Nb3U1]MCF2971223.1 BlaI/MecI/CopY family transcriptional regulator [Synechococcus sp. Nb3U1]
MLPKHRPKQLSLGPLESEILDILWELGSASTRQIHEQILVDPDRELAYASVTTVLQRLSQKGWVSCERRVDGDGRNLPMVWRPRLSRQEATSLRAFTQLQQFLAVGDPDTVAAFADSLDQASVSQLQAIAERLRAARRARREP